MPAPDFAGLLAEVVSQSRPLEFDQIHAVNTLTQLRLVQAAQETVGRLYDTYPAEARPGYLKLVSEQARAVLLVAVALDRFVAEVAADLKVEAPDEAGRLGRAYPGIAAKAADPE